MAEKPQSRRVGGIRPSQLMHTYGVGATVDLPNFSVMVAGLDDWDEPEQTTITEERLLAAVRLEPHVGPQLAEFRGAPWQPETRNPFDSWARTGVPVLPFPRWLRCSNQKCRLLASVDSKLFELEVPPTRPHLARYLHKCTARGRGAVALPARFVVACPAGHMDEFPWVEYCHKEGPCVGNPVLEAFDTGEGGRSTSMGVTCRTCGRTNYVHHAFGEGREKVLPQCRGRHPHLRRFDEKCPHQTVAMLLGASNAWFAVQRSALSIPAGGDRLSQLVAEHWGKLQLIPAEDTATPMLKMGGLAELLKFPVHDVWKEIEARRADTEEAPGDVDLRGPEWTQLVNPTTAGTSPDFRLRETEAPEGFSGLVAPTVLAERLREVVALTGFSRIDAPGAGGEARTVRLSRHSPVWLPAAETRGEGLFVRLPETAVCSWEDRAAGTERLEALREALKRWRARRGLDLQLGWPGERLVLLHSLAHALINELSLECGYAAASIRERLYSNEPGRGEPMAGFLLYTAAPDTEGTLGGLVSLGRPDVLGRLLSNALQRAMLCSTDPMCADHRPGEDDETLHGASCHACLFVPETSCELGNRFLDRTVLVATLAGARIEYFTSQM